MQLNLSLCAVCWLLSFVLGILLDEQDAFADADSRHYGVGFERVELADPMGGVMSASVWYPTKEESGTIGLGPFEFPGTWNATPTPETSAMVVISHGTGGSDLGHRNLGVALARAGIAAVAPLYPRNNFRDNSGIGDRIVWEGRPMQLAMVVQHIQTESFLNQVVSDKPLGLFGFSLGGYTVISLLTGGHDLSYFVSHCEQNKNSDPVCSFDGMDIAAQMRLKLSEQYQTPLLPLNAPEVCSSVLADPMMALIPNELLAEYPDIPTQVYLPTNQNQVSAEYHGNRFQSLNQDDQRHEKVTFNVVENAQHFSFLAPFPPALENSLPKELVSDHPDFDRAVFQQQFASDITDFFVTTLSACSM